MGLDRKQICVICATSLEARAVRRALPGVRVYETGIALVKLRGREGFEGAGGVISCGLAGGLHDRYPSGTVLVPNDVRRPDGTMLHCDADLVEALTRASRRLGYDPVADPLVTTGTIVRGPERSRWANAGYAGVDMETGLLEAPRIAAVRVVLDTPQRELSADWLCPPRALLNPRNWPEALWLARAAPRYARRAAAIAAAACTEGR